MAFQTGMAAAPGGVVSALIAFMGTEGWTSSGGGYRSPEIDVDSRVSVQIQAHQSNEPNPADRKYAVRCRAGSPLSPWVYLSCIERTVPYWFYVSPRRVIVVLKFGSRYLSLYAGKFLPFAYPTEYPLPVYVGATADDLIKFTEFYVNHRAFWDPGNDAAWVLNPSGAWKKVENSEYHSSYENADYSQIGQRGDEYITWPYASAEYYDSITADGAWPNFNFQLIPGQAHTGLFIPAHIMSTDWGSPTLGILEDVFYVPGTGLTVEQTLDLGSGRTGRVFQNAHRTSISMWAIIAER